MHRHLIIIFISSIVVMIWFVVDKDPIKRVWKHIIFESIHKYCRFFHIHIKNVQHFVFLNKGFDDAK